MHESQDEQTPYKKKKDSIEEVTESLVIPESIKEEEDMDLELENINETDFDEEVADSPADSDSSVIIDESNLDYDSTDDNMFTQAKQYLSTIHDSPDTS